MFTTESLYQKQNKEIRIKMNALKFKKWLGLTLLCVAILSAPLAQIGLQAVRDLQDKPAQLELIQDDGKQIDMIDSPHQLVNAAPAEGGADLASPVQSGSSPAVLPAGTAKMLDNTGRLQGAFINPADGEYEYVPAGTAKMLDPSGRVDGAFIITADGKYEYVPAGVRPTIDPHRTTSIISVYNPADGEYDYVPAGVRPTIDPHRTTSIVPAGYAKVVDNTGRIQGIAAVDPTNGPVRIQARGTTGSDKDDENSYVLISVIKDRRKPRR
jgi:hypothetical protein